MSDRRYYSRGWPATCRECGALAYDRASGWTIVLWSPLLIPLTLLGLPVSLPRKFRPISPEASQLSRRMTMAAVVIAMASIPLATILFVLLRGR